MDSILVNKVSEDECLYRIMASTFLVQFPVMRIYNSILKIKVWSTTYTEA
jgi:hypothetical protein